MAGAAGYAAVDSRGGRDDAGAGDYYPQGAVVKGKRTKRMRLLQVLAPRAAAPPAGSSSFTAASSSGGQHSAGSTTTEEEVDTANSLIMLAERPVVGTVVVDSEPPVEEGRGGGEGAEAETTAAGGKAGGVAYQCRTCNKCFRSFQALGGHRASHNKPKTQTAEISEKRVVILGDLDGVKLSLASSHKINTGILADDGTAITITATRSNIINHNRGGGDGDNINNHNTTTTASSSNKPRVHECAICGLEFSSGQALGGHMRRHRAPPPPAPPPPPKKEIRRNNILSLDLNLPAPMDVDDEPASASFGSSGKRPLIFLPSALVDCHH